MAIASLEEANTSAIPLKLFSLFDPTEPLFAQAGWHPLATYHRVAVLISRPYWIKPQHQVKRAKTVVAELKNYCHLEMSNLLKFGC